MAPEFFEVPKVGQGVLPSAVSYWFAWPTTAAVGQEGLACPASQALGSDV